MSRVSEAASTGDYRAQLTALRDRLAADIDRSEDPRDVATLSRELRAVLESLDALPVAGGVSKLDEIAKRRLERQAG